VRFAAFLEFIMSLLNHLKMFSFSLQDWFAFLGNGSEFNFTLVGEAFIPNTGNPSSDDNYGFCQVSSVI